jgi:microsomal dipeptidase-like Zn-dependent dipeptidase
VKKKIAIAVVALLTIIAIVLPSIVERRLNQVRELQHVPSARAKKLHARLRVADLHADSLMAPRDLADRSGRGHVDLPRLRDSGVVIQGLGLVTKVPRSMRMDRNEDEGDLIRWLAISNRWPTRTWSSPIERALYQAERALELERHEAGRFVLLRGAADVARLLERHRTDPGAIGAVLGIEGAHALEGKLDNLDRLFTAGVRSVGLAHFFDNEFCGSAHGVDKGGLTDKGRALVQRLEAKKITIDLAHASARTISDVLAITHRPPIVSHTGVVATCAGPRNLTDAQLRAIGARAGLIGIGFWDVAVCGLDPAAIARAVAHAVAVAGVDHVALGSDFDGAVTTPFDAAGLVYVTDALLAAGFDEPTIKKVMGENVIAFWARALP